MIFVQKDIQEDYVRLVIFITIDLIYLIHNLLNLNAGIAHCKLIFNLFYLVLIIR